MARVMGQWSWDTNKKYWDNTDSLGTVERKSWNSIKKGGTKRVLSQVEVTNCKIKFSIQS